MTRIGGGGGGRAGGGGKGFRISTVVVINLLLVCGFVAYLEVYSTSKIIQWRNPMIGADISAGGDLSSISGLASSFFSSSSSSSSSNKRKSGAKDVSYSKRLNAIPPLAYRPGQEEDETLLQIDRTGWPDREKKEGEEEIIEGLEALQEGREEAEAEVMEERRGLRRRRLEVEEGGGEGAAAVVHDRFVLTEEMKSQTLEDQLMQVHEQMGRPSSLTWTITNSAYSNMYDESWVMMNRVGLARSYLMVCLDEECQRYMCEHNRPYILFPHGPDLAVQVATAKFQVASILADLGINFLFIELDVWLLKNPMHLFEGDDAADIFIGGHLDNPRSLNIGIYYVKGTPKAVEMFNGLVELVQDNPQIHDQKLMNCLLRTNSLIQTTYGPEDSFHFEHKGDCDESAKNFTKGTLGTIAIYEPYRLHIFEPIQVINSLSMALFPETVSIHVLSDFSLTGNNGKTNVAKEMGIWEGAHCYWCAAKDGRYLMHDGLLHQTLLHPSYRDAHHMVIYLYYMLALAKLTNRTLIFPDIFHFEKHVPAWEFLDTTTLKGQIEWRTKNFFEKAVFEGDEDDYTIVQAHMSNRFDRLGIRRVSSLTNAEGIRAVSEIAPTSLEANYGKEDWYHLESDIRGHLGEVAQFFNHEQDIRDANILRFSTDMAFFGGAIPPCVVFDKAEREGKEECQLWPRHLPVEVDEVREWAGSCQRNWGHFQNRRYDVSFANYDCHETKRWLASLNR